MVVLRRVNEGVSVRSRLGHCMGLKATAQRTVQRHPNLVAFQIQGE
jgi:hypothetical protein